MINLNYAGSMDIHYNAVLNYRNRSIQKSHKISKCFLSVERERGVNTLSLYFFNLLGEKDV